MAGRSVVYAPTAMAATSQPLATSAALRAMQNGGNAIDGAVAAVAVLTVTEPMMTGIGGDMFALVWSAKDKHLYALNASGRAGSLMTREELLRRGYTAMPGHSAEAITVPGALRGWQTLLDRFGTMTLAQVLQPAIGYAENGFPVTPIIAHGWTASYGTAEDLAKDPGFRRTFLLEGVHAPKAGDWFRNPDYAATLRQIAAQGPDLFYKGALAHTMVDYLRTKGGFLTLDDLRTNAPTWVTPISTVFHGYRVWELPPNNQGVGVLEMLKILAPYDLKALGSNTPAYLHLMIETKKLAYADLARYNGDMDHLTAKPDELLSDAFIAERRSHLNLAHAQRRVDPGAARTQSDTVYLTVADRDGNMVSFINSNYEEWGSRIVVPGLGFVFHNRGNAFTLEPGLPNTVAPGKRPFHTLIPGFVTIPGPKPAADGTGDTPYMSFGLMGGSMQAQGHAQFLVNLLVFGMNLQEAMDTGRFRHVDGNRVNVEAAIPDDTIAKLEAMGHEVAIAPPSGFGGAQAIVKLPQGYAGASDPRKDGQAAGY